MKKSYLLIIVSLIIFSCSNNSDDELEKDTYSYTFSENSKLTIASLEETYMKYGVVEEGENLVFEYRFDAHDEELISDDEYGETIKFEIDPELNEFSYSDNELLGVNLVFTKYCYCYFPIEESKDVEPFGMISGQKISNDKWEIKIDLTFYGDEKRIVNAAFKLK